MTTIIGSNVTVETTKLDPTAPSEHEAEIRAFLTERLIGQPEAIEMGVSAYLAWKSPLRRQNTVLFFGMGMGDSRTGKSLLARLLAEFIYGDQKCLTRINMNTYKLAHAQTQGTGAPPSYVGGEKTPELSRKHLEKSRRGKDARLPLILCLEEVEKAHGDMYDILLSILDNGEIRLSDTEMHDYRDVIIIGTSNLGARASAQLGKAGIGFNRGAHEPTQDEVDRSYRNALASHYKPEFLNRIDQVVVYRRLDRVATRRIADTELNVFRNEMAALLPQSKLFYVNVTDTTLDALLDQAYEKVALVNETDEGSGSPVTELRRLLNDAVRGMLNRELLKGTIQGGDVVTIGLDDAGKITLERERVSQPVVAEAPAAAVPQSETAAARSNDGVQASQPQDGVAGGQSQGSPAASSIVVRQDASEKGSADGGSPEKSAPAPTQPFKLRAFTPSESVFQVQAKIMQVCAQLGIQRLETSIDHDAAVNTGDGVMVKLDVLDVIVRADYATILKLGSVMPVLEIQALQHRIQ